MVEKSIPLIYDSSVSDSTRKWNVPLMVQIGRVEMSQKSQEEKNRKKKKLRAKSKLLQVNDGDSPRSVIMACQINQHIIDKDPLSQQQSKISNNSDQ